MLSHPGNLLEISVRSELVREELFTVELLVELEPGYLCLHNYNHNRFILQQQPLVCMKMCQSIDLYRMKDRTLDTYLSSLAPA